jgi:hypothetical protein
MSSPARNAGDQLPFFYTQNGQLDDLISYQMDPTGPQIQGLTSVTDPLVPDVTLALRAANFDPGLYRMYRDSHLARFLSALLNAAGIGGLRRQQTIRRMSHTVSGTHFLDLDGFWGALFASPRLAVERLPGKGRFNPATAVLDSGSWAAAASRDGRYRSRIFQLGRGFNLGATYAGVKTAAEAVLGCEVDLVESWIWADLMPPGGRSSTLFSNTWFAVRTKFPTWGSMKGRTWGGLVGGEKITSTGLPLGNRGEVAITPRKTIGEDERLQVYNVLATLAPAGVVVNVNNVAGENGWVVRPPRFYYSDSNDWAVVSTVAQYQGLDDLGLSLYQNQTMVEAARPGFGEYRGEMWAYNSRMARASSYRMVDGKRTSGTDYQTVIFTDGTSKDYLPQDAVQEPRRAAVLRSGAEGVLTTYPYAAGQVGG